MAAPSLQRLQREIRICLSQDRDGGIADLTWKLKYKKAEAWVRDIPIHEAVLSNSLNCLRYLVDELKVRTINQEKEAEPGKQGYTPLQLAVIWGKVECLVYLLSRGADPMLDTDQSVVDKCRLRQERLQRAFDEAEGADTEFEGASITSAQIEPLLEEGLVMLEVLEGVEASGTFAAWARANAGHEMVRRFSCGQDAAQGRYECTSLRELVMKQRATLRPADERERISAEEQARNAARAREQLPLSEILKELGFAEANAKLVANTWSKANTLAKFRELHLSQEDIEAKLEPLVRNRHIAEGEQRKFSRWVRELEEGRVEAGPPKKAAAKAPAVAKAKPKANAALLAMAAKAKPKAKAEPAAKKRRGIDGLELMFAEALPDLAFILIAKFVWGYAT